MGEVSTMSSEETMEMILEEEEQEMEMEMEMKKESSSNKSVIRWENFLPRMFIRVLLVEADDSTRQIISALLRKCGYRVTAVSDGSKAWEMLKGRSHIIDLVLTEVELPSTSGFSLLSMIADHKSCKNIPVIMMSTHDSIGVVFKCMMKGAADFFIKPVRKNELRNLWQHVWRRHNSNSGGNGIQSGSSPQQKLGVNSENSTASTPTTDSVASAQNNKECSDKESDDHSSCTKPDTEAASAYMKKSRSPSQVRETEFQKHEEFVKSNNGLHMHESECMIVEEEHASARKITPCKDVIEDTHREDNNIPCETKQNDDEHVGPPREAIDLIGSFDGRRHEYCVVREVFCNGSKTCSDTNDTTNKLELSLRRFQPSECAFHQTDERRNLNRSNFSAFSPYNNRMVQPFYPTMLGFHAEPRGVDNSNKHVSNQGLLNSADSPQQNGGLLNNHQESTTPRVIGQPSQATTAIPCPQLGVFPIPVPGSSIDSFSYGYGPPFPSILYTQSCPQSLWSPSSVGHQESAFFENSSSQTKPESDNFKQVHDLHDQNDERCIDQIMHEQPYSNVDNVENQVCVAPETEQSRTGSLCNGAASHLNSSGSNGNVITAAIARASAECIRDEGLLVRDGIRGMDPLLCTQREMALNKFRLKRKDRCFDKKVRYQSRKKLAEQRPRVKGQFVRQNAANPPLTEAIY